MVFSSITFLFYFLPIVLIGYQIIPKKFQNLFLFISSLFFYAWGEPIYVLLMIFSTISDFCHGKLIYKFKDNKKIKTLFMISAVTINLALLGFFKYADFLIMNINNLLGTNIGLLKLGLPIGISFYTFQTMSYSIDVYRGKTTPQNNIIDFGAFVTLFPQLIAGPIVKYTDVEKELKERTPDYEKGIPLFIIGMSKKILIANIIGQLFTANPSSVFGAWFSVFCYAIQIYFDFSGYSDMATGLGYMFGFKFPKNFNYPYISKSITEFWRRWHMTLGGVFKEYVYIPLGGNRCSKLKQIRNIFIVWFLTGLWHGANWNFILWGLYFGVILLIEKLFLGKILEKLPNFFRHLYALFLIAIGWIIFAVEDLGALGGFVKSLFISGQLIDATTVFNLFNNLFIIVIAIIASTPFVMSKFEKLNNKTKNLLLMALFIVDIVFLVSSTYNPFLYFRF